MTAHEVNNIIIFSQEGEDIILYHMLKNVGVSNIRWIDVGANDPIIISVTKFFSIWGGRGLNVEPQPRYIKLLNDDRPNDINVQAGISDKDGTLMLHGDGTGATFDIQNGDTQKDIRIEVPVMTMTNLCDKFIEPQAEIHFLKIDVEGWERQCLLGLDFTKYRPWIICVESMKPGTDIPAHEEWEGIILSNGYILAGMGGINRYYVAKERREVINDYKSLDELKEQYSITHYGEYELQIKALRLLRSRWLRPARAVYHGVRKIGGLLSK